VKFEDAAAGRSADPGCSGSGSLAAAALPRRRAARAPGTSRTGTVPPDDAVRALPVLSQRVLQHRSIQRQLLPSQTGLTIGEPLNRTVYFVLLLRRVPIQCNNTRMRV
jgi:hypothetical protein